MADFIQITEIETSMTVLKETISSNLADNRLINTYFRIIDGFVRFCKKSTSQGTIDTEDVVSKYYVSVTGAVPYEYPGTTYLRKLARPILMIRDTLAGTDPARKYCYGTTVIPDKFKNDITIYENWLASMSCSKNTIYTRIGRMKPFLQFLTKSGCETLETFTTDILIEFIVDLGTRYSSAGKSNILYTLRNYFSCPSIMEQMHFDPLLFLTNMHTNKHERLESCYTPEEIRRVLGSVDRSSRQGKMLYLMMLFACVYGLRISDIRTLKISNIDWRKRFIRLNQHKTKRYLELPLTQDVCFALLDYIKNARPLTEDANLFIKQRSPHTPYSEHDHFSAKIRAYFQKAGVNTNRKHAGLHSMRHSLASSMMCDGVPLNEIATVLGHTSPQATTRYVWSDFTHLKAAALEVIPYDK